MKNLAKESLGVVLLAMLTLAGVAAVSFVVAAVAVFMMVFPAKAQDGDQRDMRWARQRFCVQYNWDNYCLYLSLFSKQIQFY